MGAGEHCKRRYVSSQAVRIPSSPRLLHRSEERRSSDVCSSDLNPRASTKARTKSALWVPGSTAKGDTSPLKLFEYPPVPGFFIDPKSVGVQTCALPI